MSGIIVYIINIVNVELLADLQAGCMSGIIVYRALAVKPERAATAYRDAFERWSTARPESRETGAFALEVRPMTETRTDNVLRFRIERQSLSNLDALARDLGVSRQDAARVALGVGLVGLRQVKDAATARPERVDVA